jgi:hypothetical protein
MTTGLDSWRCAGREPWSDLKRGVGDGLQPDRNPLWVQQLCSCQRGQRAHALPNAAEIAVFCSARRSEIAAQSGGKGVRLAGWTKRRQRVGNGVHH